MGSVKLVGRPESMFLKGVKANVEGERESFMDGWGV
jgi:hypothetical protein